MKDLSLMSEAELRALNKEVCSRIRALYSVASFNAASKFYVGQRVSFKSGKHHWSPTVIAKVDSVNTKSVSVTEVNGGKKWRVGPTLLTALDTLFSSEPVNPAPAVPPINSTSAWKGVPMSAGQKAAATRRANAEAVRENAWEAKVS